MNAAHLRQEAIRFLLGGGMNTAFSYSCYLLFNLFLPYMYAYYLAYALGILFSYVLNSRWVFKVTMSWKKFAIFPAVYLVQLGLTSGMIWVFVERIHISETLAPLIAIGLTLPVTFVMSRYILKPITAANHDGAAISRE